ncbi:MAG: ATP-binding protein [Acetobacteraceae bacterium]|nr:ATP-binding protein [Acetobacteraceae bacterium]
MPRIGVDVARVVKYLGDNYPTPADALKEYISNAIDAMRENYPTGTPPPCHVRIVLSKVAITLEYDAPGMDETDWEKKLAQVARSDKPSLQTLQIGQLGIGLLAFQTFARKVTFFSRKSASAPTIQVVLREGESEYELKRALKRDALPSPGMRIVFEQLKVDPSKARSPLGKERLTRAIGSKFSSQLASGQLDVVIHAGASAEKVTAPELNLPALAQGYSTQYPGGDRSKKVCLHLGFEARGTGKVAIRNAGVVVVEDIAAIDAEGVESGVLGSGYVSGFIDADFLRPTPARAVFEINEDWHLFLKCLERIQPSLEAEVNQYKSAEEGKKLALVAKEAITLAKEILQQDEYSDLQLLGGQARSRGQPTGHGSHPTGERTGGRSRKPGDHADTAGLRISFMESDDFPDAYRHSRFERALGTVLANKKNRDFAEAQSKNDLLAYGAILIGKETIAYNNPMPAVDESMERLLSFIFDVRRRVAGVTRVRTRRSA